MLTTIQYKQRTRKVYKGKGINEIKRNDALQNYTLLSKKIISTEAI